jgi:transcription initiation factor TFIID subunit 10
MVSKELVNFLKDTEDYMPTIPLPVVYSIARSTGLNVTDPIMAKMMAIVAQKFISDIALDSLEHWRMRTSLLKGKAKNSKCTLTMHDLQKAMEKRGTSVQQAPYFL